MCAIAQTCGGQRATWGSQFCLSTLRVAGILLSSLALASVYPVSRLPSPGKCFNKWRHFEDALPAGPPHSLPFLLLSRSWCLMVVTLPLPQVTSSRSRW